MAKAVFVERVAGIAMHLATNTIKTFTELLLLF